MQAEVSVKVNGKSCRNTIAYVMQYVTFKKITLMHTHCDLSKGMLWSVQVNVPSYQLWHLSSRNYNFGRTSKILNPYS